MEYKKIIQVLQENDSTSICCIAQARWRGFFTTDILRGRRVCKSKKEHFMMTLVANGKRKNRRIHDEKL